jgi:hypothetical protein
MYFIGNHLWFGHRSSPFASIPRIVDVAETNLRLWRRAIGSGISYPTLTRRPVVEPVDGLSA